MYKLTPAAYVWTHGYLRTIQVGIQSAHVIAELFVNYEDRGVMTYDWARNHKTLRLLNGGTGEVFQTNLEDAFVIAEKYKLEMATFNEPDLGNIVTGFGMIIDPGVIDHIEGQRDILADQGYTEGDREMDEFPLVQFLRRCPSAT